MFYRKALKAAGKGPPPSDFAFDRASAFAQEPQAGQSRGVSVEQIQTKYAKTART